MDSTAAQKVLAIPELLEKILIHATPLERSERTFLCGRTRPSTELFRLQKVSKFFRNTISGSDMLQQRMFIRPYSSDDTRGDRQDAIDWMMGVIGVCNNGTELYGSSGFLSIHRVAEERGPHLKRPEASWRKILAHSVRGGSNFNVTHHGPEKVTLLTVRARNGMTLGQLHDGLQHLIPYMVMWAFAVDARPSDVQYYRKQLEDECRWRRTWR